MTDTLLAPAPIETRGRIAAGISAATLVAAVARLFLPEPEFMPLGLVPEWLAVVIAALATVAMLAIGPRAPRAGLPRRGLLAAGWAACAGLLAVAADGIAFDVLGSVIVVIGLVTGSGGGVDLPVDWAGMATRIPALVAGAWCGAATLAYQRRSRGGCPRCGETPGGGRRLAAVVRVARWAAYPAALLPLAYGGLKAAWGLGSTAGLRNPEALGEVGFWSPGIGDTVVLALIGTAIALALALQWPVPRWMLIAGGWLGAAMLIPVGVFGIVGVASGAADGSDFAAWVVYGIYPLFLTWGLSLGVAVWSYQYRTRRPCPGHH